MTRQKAETLRRLIEQVVVDLEDKDASEGAELFPQLKADGSLVSAGTRINWNGSIKRASVDLWDTEINNPDNAPDLWKDIKYKDGYRIIPETIAVTELFSVNEYGWWGDVLYISKADNNAYTPAQYLDNWEVVDQTII